MVKLIHKKKTQKNKQTKKLHQVQEQQKIQSFGKSSGVILQAFNPGIGV
jgi:hypothetical protein